MAARLPGQPRLADLLMRQVRLNPGCIAGDIQRSLGMRNLSQVHEGLERLVEQGLIERRRVTMEDHMNVGKVGYFGLSRDL